MRIGIIFGGPSREREISFAGGKTAFEYLDKSLFQPIPVFVDSFGRFIKLREEHMYASGIRQFYPSHAEKDKAYDLYIESYPELARLPVPPETGEWIQPSDLSDYIDFALLAMHGPDCEDGAIQGLLEWYKIPYSGPGIMGSSLGIDKILQNKMIARINGQQKKTITISYRQWQQRSLSDTFAEVKAQLGLPVVIKAPHQGSSIGVAIVKEDSEQLFEQGINQCFFQHSIDLKDWKKLSPEEKHTKLQQLADLDKGIGFPLYLDGQIYFHPVALESQLNQLAEINNGSALLLSANTENELLLEEFIEGQEFSCGCIQDLNGDVLVLPPTEIIKMVDVFDFDAKYKPGTTRKSIPVRTTLENNRRIQEYIGQAFAGLGLGVCTRIDGFLTASSDILLHDPNTIPGMSPASLIFKQMAEIGLNVTQSLTYFIRNSIAERIRTSKNTVTFRQLLDLLDNRISESRDRQIVAKGILFDADQNSFAAAKQRYVQETSRGHSNTEAILKRGNDLYILPLPLLIRDEMEQVLEGLDEERNELLTETSARAFALTQFFGGRTDLSARKIADLTIFGEIIKIK